MRVRAQSATGDYTFGNGSANFLVNNVEFTRQMSLDYMGLNEGEWFLDNTRGLALFQSILGYSNPATRDLVTKARLLQTPSLSAIESFSSETDNSVRSYDWTADVQSQFSKTPVTVSSEGED